MYLGCTWDVSGVCLGCVWGVCLGCVSGLSGFSPAAAQLLFGCSLAARPAGLGSVRDENEGGQAIKSY